jgi:hypothetical protein
MYDILLKVATEFELLAKGQAQTQESTLGAYQDVLTGRNPRGPNLAGVDLDSGSIIQESPIVQDIIKTIGQRGTVNSSMQIKPDFSVAISTAGTQPVAKKVQIMLQKKWAPPMQQALRNAYKAKVVGAPQPDLPPWSPWLSIALE